MTDYKQVKDLLMKLFDNDNDKVNQWLHCPNHLLGKFSPITLILIGDGDMVLQRIQAELDRKEKKK